MSCVLCGVCVFLCMVMGLLTFINNLQATFVALIKDFILYLSFNSHKGILEINEC